MKVSLIEKRQGGTLPHWTKPDGIYDVCFRLADSVPQRKIHEWIEERDALDQWAQRAKRPLSSHDRLRLLKLHSEKIDQYLANGYGSCCLRRERVAGLIQNALRHFEGLRYKLFAWCIMPNHVHVIFQPTPSFSTSSILHSWKSFTALKVNEMLERTGPLWQKESFDHLIRNGDGLRIHIDYVWNNPEEARLRNWRWRWKLDDDEVNLFTKKHPEAF